MSVTSVQSNNWMSQISPMANGPVARSNDGDGDDGGQRVSRGEGGGFASAIGNALAQIGATLPSVSSNASSTSDSSSSSQDPAQALSSFMQNLMAALHAQNAQGSTAQSNASQPAASGDNAGAPPTHHAHGGHQHMQADLQSLIQQLSSSSSTDSSSSSGSSPDSNLQQSFQNLMSSLGDTSSNATLSNFLQALGTQMDGAGKSGNAVSTSA